MEWLGIYECPNETVNMQHKKLVKIITSIEELNQINDALIQSLLDYTHYHFEYEEGLMLDAGYKDFKQHNREHTLFILQVKELISESKSRQLVIFLKQWLDHHIRIVDRKFFG